jgi:Phosphodiester glycosidase
MRQQLLSCLLPILLTGCAETLPTNPSSPAPTAAPTQASNPPTTNPLSPPPTPSPIAATTSPAGGVTHTTQTVGNSIAHIVKIQGGYRVKPVIADDLQTVAQFAQKHQAIAAINGGFFDPKNQQTTSYVVMNQKTVADPKQNPQLTENPKLKQYLRQIFDRSEFRRYDCGGKTSYGIQAHSKPAPDGCQIADAIGGGPQLLPEVQAQREGFTDPELGRDAIGSQVPNARSAIGITKDDAILLVMVAQTQPKTGVTLAELATLMKSLGAESAMNLDGGSSSAIFYANKSVIGNVNDSGKSGERMVKSAIVVVAE